MIIEYARWAKFILLDTGPRPTPCRGRIFRYVGNPDFNKIYRG